MPTWCNFMLYLKNGMVGIDFYTGSELQIKFVVHGKKNLVCSLSST